MKSDKKIAVLAPVPRGNTEKGVNAFILAWLLQRPPQRVLDIPCGQGALTEFLSLQFPQAKVFGADIYLTSNQNQDPKYLCIDASKPFSAPPDLDVIISASGVMDFDNTASFVESCSNGLKSGGIFFLTNDNIQSLRDRLSFLFFGRFRRFSLFIKAGGPTFHPVSLQLLHKILQEKGFRLKDVRYLSALPEDFLLLPLAIPFYLAQLIYMWREESPIPLKTRLQLFPWRCMIYRHYVVVSEKI